MAPSRLPFELWVYISIRLVLLRAMKTRSTHHADKKDAKRTKRLQCELLGRRARLRRQLKAVVVRINKLERLGGKRSRRRAGAGEGPGFDRLPKEPRPGPRAPRLRLRLPLRP